MATTPKKVAPLEALFAPQSIAVIGATERFPSIGYTVLTNLLEHQGDRKIYPVNLKRKTVLGLTAYTTIQALPEVVDLAVIVTPAPTVPGLIKACGKHGVKNAVIISAGFKESGLAGARLEKQVLREAQQGQVRIVGPSCFGVMNPHLGLNATIATSMAQPGSVGFLSQSGAFDAAILDWSLRDSIGFSVFMSLGTMIDIGWGEAIAYLGQDPNTKSILIYMESMGDVRTFLSAARKVALDKPIIVLKAGKTEAGAEAVRLHTGALPGSDDVFTTAFRRVGVLQVEQAAHLFYMAEVLAKQPRPKGPNLTIITNAGGPGILATDALVKGGGQLTTLSPETKRKLQAFLPDGSELANPIDLLSDADPLRYIKAMDVALADAESDGLLVILTPQHQTAATPTAREIKKLAPRSRKPILASWMGGADTASGSAILSRANIPTFDYPDTAARIFNYMWQYSRNLRSLYEMPTLDTTPLAVEGDETTSRQWVTDTIRAARDIDHLLLTEFESKQLLAAYEISTVETRLASDEADAVAAANEIGYPVVVKLNSATIIHKSNVKGVHLNLPNEAAVRLAFQTIRDNVPASDFSGVTVQPMLNLSGYEFLIGSKIDDQFGPVLLFGAGGRLASMFDDVALGLPPLTSTLARRMMADTRIYHQLQRHAEIDTHDLDRLAQILVRFSQLIVEQPQIQAIDINPLLLTQDQAIVLDANIQVHPMAISDSQLPTSVIRPYPNQYVYRQTLPDGSEVVIRPIRPEDETRIIEFHETLSDTSVYYRYFQLIPFSRRVDHDRLSRVCFIDYDREIALVVNRKDSASGKQAILGVGRLVKQTGTQAAEFAIIVSDAWQRQGIGRTLLEKLIDIARAEGVSLLTGTILPENSGMIELSKKVGFNVMRNYEEGVVQAELML